MHCNLSKLYAYNNNHQKSVKCLLEALEVFLSLFGENNEYVVETLVQLGQEHHILDD